MINTLKKSIIILIGIYLYLVSFGGILTKITINNSILFSIKQIIPDIILVFIIFISIIVVLVKKLQNKFKWNILIILYFSICIVLSYVNVNGSYMDTIYTIRDVYLPFLLLFLILQIDLYDTYKEKINKMLVHYSVIITIFGFILAVFEYIKGFEWTSSFYTGYVFYGMNEKANIMINYTINGKLRVPSITGSSVLFGFYSLIAFVIILNKFKKGFSQKIFIIISIANIILSTNKTCIFLVFIIIYLCILRVINGYKKIIFLLISCIGAMGILLYLISFTNIFFSVQDRLNTTWASVFSDIDILSLIAPYNSFNIGSAIRNIMDVKSYVDNSYIYILLTYGIIGLFIYVYIMLEIAVNVSKNKIIIRQLTLIAFISGVTISIFQGRSYFTLYCMIIGLLYSFKKNIRGKENDISNI